MVLDNITNKKDIIGNYNPNDEYYTPIYAIKPIEEELKRNSTILCPFDTKDSLYVKYFISMGHSVIYSHIEHGVDFFNLNIEDIKDVDYIISNPPYSKKNEVFNKLFELDKPFAMLVGVVGIFESKHRFQLFKQNKFEIMYFDKRISYFTDYNNSNILDKNPPFSSVYICKDILKDVIVFKEINKK